MDNFTFLELDNAQSVPKTPLVQYNAQYLEIWGSPQDINSVPGPKLSTRYINPRFTGPLDIPPVVAFVGEAGGAEEDTMQLAFVGAAGKKLQQVIDQHLSQIPCIITNIVPYRPENNALPSKEQIYAGMRLLCDTLSKYQASLQYVVLLGNTPLYAFTGKKAISKERGNLQDINSVLTKLPTHIKIMPTYHPMATGYNPTLLPYFIQDLKTVASKVLQPSYIVSQKESAFYFTLVQDFKTFIKMREACLGKDCIVGLDIETVGLDPLAPDAKVLCIGIASYATQTKICNNFCVPLERVYYSTALLTDYHVSDIIRIILSSECAKVFHRAQFDLRFLKSYYGLPYEPVNFVGDTLPMHHLLDENALSHKLEILTRDVLNDYTDYKEQTEKYLAHIKLKKDRTYDKLPPEHLFDRAARDANNTLRIYLKLLPMLKQEDLLPAYCLLTVPSILTIVDMEHEGILIDTEYAKMLLKKYEARQEQIKQEILTYLSAITTLSVPEDFNLNSPKQLSNLLYNSLKLPVPKLTDNKVPSVDEEALEALVAANPKNTPLKLIAAYRTLGKVKSTYIEGVLKHLDLYDRVHSSFSVSTTKTHRLSSKEPNLQNVITDDKLIELFPGDTDYEIKRMFIAKTGFLFVYADYKQIEIRIGAIIAKEPTMLRFVREGLDVHTMVGVELYHKPAELITEGERRRVKTLVFGIFYGMGVDLLASELQCSKQEAQAFLDLYFERFPALKQYYIDTEQQLRTKFYVKDLFGRRRRALGILSENKKVQYEAIRQTVNAPIQGTAAGITLHAMNRIRARFKQENLPAKLLLNVHDAIMAEVQKQYVDKVAHIYQEEMVDNMKFSWLTVPLAIDLKMGINQRDLKKYQI